MVAAFTGIPAIRFGDKPKRMLCILGLILVAAGAVGSYAPRMALKRAYHIVRGDLVDVGGYRLRIDCYGSGEPTVVMDSGLEHDRFAWGTVPANVAGFTRVCTYDRAGLGESDIGPRPRTSQLIVDEFDRLLKNANIKGPYVLVGHSFGGVNMRLYASQHPESVVGLVLVDASQEDQIARYTEIMAPDEKTAWLHHEGGDNKEWVNVIASLDELRTAPLPPSLLLTVISAKKDGVGKNAPAERLHTELQEKLAELVPVSKHVVVENTGHFIQLDHPQIVIQAVQDMVNTAREQRLGETRSSYRRLAAPLRARPLLAAIR
jgi:pimeloyl-ACP methyl ester carboxylesterase